MSRTQQQLLEQLLARTWHGAKLGLERIQRVLGELMDPQEQLPCLHVAGTGRQGEHLHYGWSRSAALRGCVRACIPLPT